MTPEGKMSVSEIKDGLEAGRQDGVRTHRPFWPTGVALLIVVLLLLGGATILNQRLRPKVGFQPVTIARAHETPRIGFIVGRHAPTDSSRDGDPVAAPSPETATDSIEIDLALVEEVEAAYSNFWNVRAAAAFDRDASRLAEVAAGPALERELEQITDLETRGVAAVIEVEHEVGLLSLTHDEAELYDEYLNRSYLIDPATKEPVGAPESEEVVKVMFRLQRIDGVWKVVDSERHS